MCGGGSFVGGYNASLVWLGICGWQRAVFGVYGGPVAAAVMVAVTAIAAMAVARRVGEWVARDHYARDQSSCADGCRHQQR